MYFSRVASRRMGVFKTFRLISSKASECQVEELKERGVLRVSGPDSSQFLQGLVTNDVRKLEDGSSRCIYTMFLNTKGRVLYDALIYKDPRQGFLLECDASCVDDLSKHIRMYKLRKKVDLVHDPGAKVRVIFGPVSSINDSNAVIVQDPRHQDLGHRVITDQSHSIPCSLVEGVYKENRFKLGIAEGESEISKGEMFPLEMNLDYLGGVSFDKGCYLGQEVTSRTKHTGVVRKRLMPLEFSPANSPQPNLDIREKEEGKREKLVAKVKAVYNNLGIGIVRLSDVASPAITAAGIIVKQPEWWPQQNST